MAGAWDVIAGALGFGGPSGNDHGSSNWAAWGHEEIRSMLDHSVEAGDIFKAAQAWRDQARTDAAIVTGLTRDLQQTVSGGWYGASADAALAPLYAIDRWAASHADTAAQVTRLMEDSGSAAAQAKASVPPPKSHSWMETLAVTAVTGPAGGLADAVMQEQEQSEAHAEAVRIMTNVYSAPINDHRAAAPTYLQLADPTLPQPDQVPTTEPAPGTLYSALGGSSAGIGGMGGAHRTQPPDAAALQGVASGGGAHPGPPHGGQVASVQAARQPWRGDGETAAMAAAAAAAGVPIAAPVGAAAMRRPWAVSGAPKFGAGHGAETHPDRGPSLGEEHPGRVGRTSAGHATGSRPSSAAAEVAEGRMGSLARGAGTAAAERGAVGGLMPPTGAAGGKRGEDSEHRRPSYLIEMDDVFADSRKVAPAVIGEDPAGHGGPS
jgi:hypothetical protein